MRPEICTEQRRVAARSGRELCSGLRRDRNFDAPAVDRYIPDGRAIRRHVISARVTLILSKPDACLIPPLYIHFVPLNHTILDVNHALRVCGDVMLVGYQDDRIPTRV